MTADHVLKIRIGIHLTLETLQAVVLIGLRPQLIGEKVFPGLGDHLNGLLLSNLTMLEKTDHLRQLLGSG
jgi:hypothetical protein